MKFDEHAMVDAFAYRHGITAEQAAERLRTIEAGYAALPDDARMARRNGAMAYEIEALLRLCRQKDREIDRLRESTAPDPRDAA